MINKVKQFRYRPGVKLRFPDFKTTAQDGGKVVSLTHRPPLPPGNAPGTHFCWGPRWHSGYGAVLQIGRLLVRSQLVSVDFSLE